MKKEMEIKILQASGLTYNEAKRILKEGKAIITEANTEEEIKGICGIWRT